VSCHTRRLCLTKMSLESRFMGQFPILSITWSILGSCCSRTKSYYWSRPTWSFIFFNFPFLFTKMSKLLLLFSLRSIYIYTFCIYNSTLTSLLSVPTLYFLRTMEVRVVGEAMLKRDFWIANFGDSPKIQIPQTPNKYCISTNHTSIKNIPRLLVM